MAIREKHKEMQKQRQVAVKPRVSSVEIIYEDEEEEEEEEEETKEEEKEKIDDVASSVTINLSEYKGEPQWARREYVVYFYTKEATSSTNMVSLSRI